MKKNAKKAWDKLKAIGAPVLDPNRGWGGHFAISGELYGQDNGFYQGHIDHDVDGLPWADYYCEYGVHSDTFGVSPHINKILEDNDLYCEWVNAGVLAVYDN